MEGFKEDREKESSPESGDEKQIAEKGFPHANDFA
jgi:hypothetical protein